MRHLRTFIAASALTALSFTPLAEAAPVQPVAADTAAIVSGYLQPAFYGQCVLGSAQCFNGWFRVCQLRGNMTMWITGARRC